MKVSLLQENFSKALGIVSRSIAPKAALPVLANIAIATEKGRLKLSATNLECGINLWLGAKVEKEGSIAVPAKILTEFVSSLPPEKINLEVKENNLFLSTPGYKANFAGSSLSEFPPIASSSGKADLIFKKEEFAENLAQVVFAAATDEGRPVLTGVLLRLEGQKLSLVATDGYRLSVKKIEIKEGLLKEDLLVPAKALLEVARISQEKGDEEKEIKMALTNDKNQIVFSLPGIDYSSRLIDGEFPDFAKIIPETNETKAEFDREEFFRAVKTASIFAREQANIVKLKFEPGKLTVSAETPQVGGNETEIEAKVSGSKLEIAFNCRFLLDLLGAVVCEELVFEAGGALNPGVFRPKGDASFFHLIMPVRIQA